ncbi:MAG TPA: hypothetical protein VJL54_01390 [Nitrososphaera sp.]|nr:hypothetical protein [Nitrososphaera sp.]
MSYYNKKRMPRGGRRARKPMQEDWKRVPRGKWLKCTYGKCGYTWQYFGDRNWAECPACHSSMKVAIAHRNYRLT